MILVLIFTLTLIITLFAFLGHLTNYRRPEIQRNILRIQFVAPLYSLSSLIPQLRLLADSYEAFAIYCFFRLLRDLLHGDSQLLVDLESVPRVSKHIDLADPVIFVRVNRAVFQFVLVKPVVSLITTIVSAHGLFNVGDFSLTSWWLWLSLLYNARYI